MSQLGTGGYVERVEDVVQVGQVVRVRVAEVDTERGRVSLSMREPRPAAAPQRDRSAPVAPRTPRPASAGGFSPTWTPEPAPEQRPERRFRTGDRNTGKSEERPARRNDRPRRNRDNDDEEWRSVRVTRETTTVSAMTLEEEPAPTTAEELVARFGRRDSSK